MCPVPECSLPGRELVSEEGEIGPAQFEAAIRKQVRLTSGFVLVTRRLVERKARTNEQSVSISPVPRYCAS